MAITYSQLRTASASPQVVVAKTISEARERGFKTAFMCHSHKDHTLVKGAVALLTKAGWDVYVDWLDASLPDRPDRSTAATIKKKIESSHYFLFLATENSMVSRWCPWEIGYADGVKAINQIFVIPTKGDDGRNHGNEYLGLYRKIDFSKVGPLAAWQPGGTGGVYVKDIES